MKEKMIFIVPIHTKGILQRFIAFIIEEFFSQFCEQGTIIIPIFHQASLNIK
jgi:hypothetical protein